MPVTPLSVVTSVDNRRSAESVFSSTAVPVVSGTCNVVPGFTVSVWVSTMELSLRRITVRVAAAVPGLDATSTLPGISGTTERPWNAGLAGETARSPSALVDHSAATTGCVAVIRRPDTSPRRAASSGIVTVDAASMATASAPAAANVELAESTSTLTVVRRSEVLVTTRLRAPVPPGAAAIVALVAAAAEAETQSLPPAPVTRAYVDERELASAVAQHREAPRALGGDAPLRAVERHVDRGLRGIRVGDEKGHGVRRVSDEAHERLLYRCRAARREPQALEVPRAGRCRRKAADGLGAGHDVGLGRTGEACGRDRRGRARLDGPAPDVACVRRSDSRRENGRVLGGAHEGLGAGDLQRYPWGAPGRYERQSDREKGHDHEGDNGSPQTRVHEAPSREWRPTLSSASADRRPGR